MTRIALASIAFALLLAGCSLPPPRPAGDAHMSWYDKYPNWKPGDPWPDESGAASAAPPLPTAEPKAETSAAAAQPAPQASRPEPAPLRQAALPPAAQPPAEPPPEPPKLDELRGMNSAQLTALLGKPTLMRNEATGQMWQYRGETCVLHLFLYPSGAAANSEKRVQYVEARARQTGASAVTSGPSECLATLVGARRLRS
ncbi:MAG TPA: hypothetical protein VFS04_05845 [Alphaproteobacteria bacterium]|nr:hypothetical protein [Alphaproteobacteria bacterium]